MQVIIHFTVMVLTRNGVEEVVANGEGEEGGMKKNEERKEDGGEG